MDYDGRSAVSSFYGGRKNSLDALNSDFPAPNAQQSYAQPARNRYDSASSFYNADRASRGSADILGGGGQHVGYNQTSFFQPVREEPVKGGFDEEANFSPKNDDFNIYNDFNNAGPKYSTAFGMNDVG